MAQRGWEEGSKKWLNRVNLKRWWACDDNNKQVCVWTWLATKMVWWMVVAFGDGGLDQEEKVQSHMIGIHFGRRTKRKEIAR